MNTHPSVPQCHVSYSDDGVVTARFDNGRLNLLTEEAASIYAQTLGELSRRNDIRLLVIQGGDSAFLGGADIKFLKDARKADIDAYIRSVYRLCETIRDIPYATMSVISGYCLGAGMEVAAVCDFKIAAAEAQFGMPEVKLGVPSVIHGAMLPGMIGWTRTRDLLLSGRIIPASLALSWGLITDIANEGGLDATVTHWKAELLANGPASMRIQKKLIRDWERMPLQEAINIGIEGLVSAYDTDEPKRYMEAFLANRKRRAS
ncbi:enoyl-CoA hydratase-related protein [Alicycliphilus denitrificans]|uniref:enoyl-CoA hydratase-related protein n=1 Tax=Alicycliphilus denitrificans TaxID=179636 RepID=UPI003A7F659E